MGPGTLRVPSDAQGRGTTLSVVDRQLDQHGLAAMPQHDIEQGGHVLVGGGFRRSRAQQRPALLGRPPRVPPGKHVEVNLLGAHPGGQLRFGAGRRAAQVVGDRRAGKPQALLMLRPELCAGECFRMLDAADEGHEAGLHHLVRPLVQRGRLSRQPNARIVDIGHPRNQRQGLVFIGLRPGHFRGHVQQRIEQPLRAGRPILVPCPLVLGPQEGNGSGPIIGITGKQVRQQAAQPILGLGVSFDVPAAAQRRGDLPPRLRPDLRMARHGRRRRLACNLAEDGASERVARHSVRRSVDNAEGHSGRQAGTGSDRRRPNHLIGGANPVDDVLDLTRRELVDFARQDADSLPAHSTPFLGDPERRSDR